MRAAAPQAFLQPHPFEPLRLTLRKDSEGQPAGSAAARQRVEQPVELAGAVNGPRVPQAELKTEEPVLTGRSSTPPVQVAQAQLTPTPAALQQEAKPQAQSQPADGAPINLAVWTGSAAAAAPAVSAATPEASAAIAPPQVPAPAATRPGFADVAAIVAALPVETSSERPAAPARTETPPTTTRNNTRNTANAGTGRAATRQSTPNRGTTTRNAAARTTEAAARPATPARTAAPAHPSRIWVQLAVAPERAGFGYEMSRMRRVAPALLKDRTPHAAPIGRNQRLLVGPFPTAAEARDFVNELKKKDIEALSWTSPAGTAVERVAAGK